MAKGIPGVHLSEVSPAAALVMELGEHKQVAQFFSDKFDLPLPSPGKRTHRQNISSLYISPGKYLVLSDAGEESFVTSLIAGLSGLAAVTDQSSGLRTLRLSGQGASASLQSRVAIDLHETNFPSGSTAATVIGLMRVHVSRIDDSPTYEVSVARSLAENLIPHLHFDRS